MGFEGFETIQSLTIESSKIPKKAGIYMILYPLNTEPQFKKNGTGGHFKGKNPNVSIEKLQNNYLYWQSRSY
jgi:hypothetical protein